MLARLLMAAGAMALALLQAGGAVAQVQKAQPQAKGQKAGPTAAQCKAEDERLRALAARLRIEVEGPATRQINEPITVSVSGLSGLQQASRNSGLEINIAFGGSITPGRVESDAWGSDRPDKPVAALAFTRGLQTLTLKAGSSKLLDRTWVLVNANALGGLEVLSAISVENDCGARLLSPVGKRVLTIATDPREASLPATGSAGRCAAEAALFRGIADTLEMKIEGRGATKVGEPVTVSWKRGGERFPMSLPVFIVMAMPEEVRFQGFNMLPIPAGGRVPADIKYGEGQMRVFVPLSTRSAPDAGTFEIKPYRSGSFPISFAVVMRTACGEVVHRESKSGIEVEPGAPKLVVQDFFSLEKPERVVTSGNGRYRLEIFKASYRVFDVASGIKIVDRAGRSPNFSGAARFVVAYIEGSEGAGGALEVVDLVTQEPVPDFVLRGPTIAWGIGDAIVIDGTVGHPEMRIRRALVDPTVKSDPNDEDRKIEHGLIEGSLSGRGSSAWQRFRIGLALDQGFVVFSDRASADIGEEAVLEIYDLTSGKPIITGTTSGGANVDAERERPAARFGGRDVAQILALHGIKSFAFPDGWSLGEPLRISHYSRTADELLASDGEDSGQRKAKTDDQRAALQATYYFDHATPPATTNAPLAVRVASEASPTVRARSIEDWRARTVRGARQLTGTADYARFARQLEPFALCIDPGCSKGSRRESPRAWVKSSSFLEWTFQYGTQTTTFTAPPVEIERLLVSDVPAAKAVMKGDPNRVCYGANGDPSFPEPDDDSKKTPSIRWHFPFRFIPTPSKRKGKEMEGGNTDVHGAWSWQAGGSKFWLVQTVCSHAGILNAPVTLFARGQKGAGAIYQLGGGAQDPKDLNEHISPPPNEFVLRVRPFIVNERWLLIAAPASNAAAVIDLRAPDKPTFVQNMHDVFATQELFRTTDGRHLVQLNTDGRFYVYRIADSEHVISGRWIDDEIVFVTDEGYYDGTYEGAQFIHLRFPGVEGVYSLAQFERPLRRPDLIKAMLAGKEIKSEPPRLAVPPQVEIDLAAVAVGKPTIGIKATSVRGLKAIRLFEDGRLLQRIDVGGNAAATEAALGQMPSGRWLTAIAEDQDGVLSAPATIAVPKPAKALRRLHGVVVGVDRYAEERLTLHYASSDARKIAQAVGTPRGGYYAEARITPLLNEAAGPDAILKALEGAIEAASASDTVLFTFAGHGVRAPNGSYVLTASGFHSSVPAESGLAWLHVAAVLARSKARVIVVLDACRSGLTGAAGLATNDDAVADILKGTTAPIVVFAAAKGRQDSYEDDIAATQPRWGGGAFTHALVGALAGDWKAHDVNGNGALEISELYRAVKGKVVGDTAGAQTPWLVRQDLVGDFAIF